MVWAFVLAGWFYYQRSTGLGTVATLQRFIDGARGGWWAFSVFIVVYTIRPLVLFPASLLTVAGGLLFGPLLGIVATVVGANASALFAYWLARSLGFDPSGQTDAGEGVLGRWAERMRAESFLTVLLMRLAFLPYDLVNYGAGFLRIRPGAFLLATAIGSLPGTISFTLAGASIESLEQGPSGVDPWVLAASALLFFVSVLLAPLVKRGEMVRFQEA
jgi:uncharacterized membrane protein YdjX (TVP38/TMEM64 family)